MLQRMQFAPDDLSDDVLMNLVDEYIDLIHTVQALQLKEAGWWSDDPEGEKAAAYEELMRQQGDMLYQFPFLMHVTPRLMRRRH